METTTCEEKHLENLDLDAPLMSTRRLCSNSNSTATSNAIQTKEISRRVPFLWERAAGVPFVNSKEEVVEQEEEEEKEEEILPPKPPPGRCRNLSPEEIIKVEEDDPSVYDCEDEVFLDALDNLSISESMSSFRRSPSFIMDRFLPAANAIAASSSSSTFQQAPKKMKRRRAPCSHPHEKPSPEWLKKPRLKQQQCTNNSKLELQQCVPRSHESPSKACGLMLFFPWSLKNNLCGFKSATPPVRCRKSPMPVSVSVRGSLRCTTSNDQVVRWKDIDDNDKMSSKACQSPGWGLPFLNSSSSSSSRSSKVSRRTRFVDDEMKERGRSLMFNPPQLKPPTDSWLHHALTRKLK